MELQHFGNIVFCASTRCKKRVQITPFSMYYREWHDVLDIGFSWTMTQKFGLWGVYSNNQDTLKQSFYGDSGIQLPNDG